ncbi:hypothetical protein EAI_04305 [Harpegnathos saltator]|uniref:Uncharacterized protein n=1 Tax=Harpegnathos saltator TaxID=610380 RepID=E2BZQ3_HARSA|nr:hypothetical protein EAI_04305 [Harpegnathos saltator]
MEIRHHYELRSKNKSHLHNLMISNQKELNLEMMEHCYDIKNKNYKRFCKSGEVTNSKRIRRSNKIHKKNMKVIESNKERSMTGDIMDEQNTKSVS